MNKWINECTNDHHYKHLFVLFEDNNKSKQANTTPNTLVSLSSLEFEFRMSCFVYLSIYVFTWVLFGLTSFYICSLAHSFTFVIYYYLFLFSVPLFPFFCVFLLQIGNFILLAVSSKVPWFVCFSYLKLIIIVNIVS